MDFCNRKADRTNSTWNCFWYVWICYLYEMKQRGQYSTCRPCNVSYSNYCLSNFEFPPEAYYPKIWIVRCAPSLRQSRWFINLSTVINFVSWGLVLAQACLVLVIPSATCNCVDLPSRVLNRKHNAAPGNNCHYRAIWWQAVSLVFLCRKNVMERRL
jgi:hypothetical protein